MPQRIQCPICAKTLVVGDSNRGKVRCPECMFNIDLALVPTVAEPTRGPNVSPADDELDDDELDELLDDEDEDEDGDDEDDNEPEEDDDPATAARAQAKLGFHAQMALIAALAWFFLGLVAALAMPRLALSPLRGMFGTLQILITFGLIGWNLFEAVRLLGRTGKVLAALPFTLTQLLLFPLLFFQVYCVLGAHHYEFSRAPTGLDWVVFAGVHGFRAADVVDTLQVFNLQVQNIRHHSGLLSGLLMLYHLVIDFFMIAVLFRALQWMRHAYYGRFAYDYSKRYDGEILFHVPLLNLDVSKGWLGMWGVFFMLWALPAFFGVWTVSEMGCWFAENSLRVADVIDLMELWDLHLYESRGFFDGLLALFFRLLIMGVLLGLVGAALRGISVHWLGGLGSDQEALREARLSYTGPLRDALDDRLEAMGADATSEYLATRPSRWLPLEGWLAVGTAALVCALPLVYLSRWDTAIERLTVTAVEGDDDSAARALDALARLGPRAEAATDRLVNALPKMPAERQTAALSAVGTLGETGRAALLRLGTGNNPQMAQAALAGFEKAGAAAAPALLEAAVAGAPNVRESARQSLLNLGADATQPLLDGVTAATAKAAIPYLDALDPNWMWRTTVNPVGKNLQVVAKAIKTVKTSNNSLDLTYAARDLGTSGSLGAVAAADLINLFERESFSQSAPELVGAVKMDVHESAAIALANIGAEAVPALVEGLRSPNLSKVRGCLTALKRMGPAGAAALPELQHLVAVQPAGIQPLIGEAIRAVAPHALLSPVAPLRPTHKRTPIVEAPVPAPPEPPSQLVPEPAPNPAPQTPKPAKRVVPPPPAGALWVSNVASPFRIALPEKARPSGKSTSTRSGVTMTSWTTTLRLEGIAKPVNLSVLESQYPESYRDKGVAAVFEAELTRIHAPRTIVALKETPWKPGFAAAQAREFLGVSKSQEMVGYRCVVLNDASRAYRVRAEWTPTPGENTRALADIMNSIHVDEREEP